MTTSATRRKRPHPARRARRIAGSAAIAGMALLTAGMAGAGKLPTTPSVTAATTTNQASAGTATGAASRSVSVAAVPATASASAPANTSTHAS